MRRLSASHTTNAPSIGVTAVAGDVILPGSTIGVLGSGQLGRMFAIAARTMGYRVHTLSPEDDTPTGQVADREIRASYADLDAVREFARNVAVVTFEFENVPTATAEAAASVAPVRPTGEVLHITQNRLREKNFLQSIGIPTAPFWPIRSATELSDALRQLNQPAVLKTSAWGYDGKGQVKIANAAADTIADEAEAAWGTLNAGEGVLEGFIDFACEVSVVAARSMSGEFAHFGVVLNTHRNHILDTTVAPAPLESHIADEAVQMSREILQRLGVVGVMVVEFFLTRDDRLLVNELAPRPHNSGHFTFDACLTCQFEQQLRAVCGLPLGSTTMLRPAAMANLLGDLWNDGEPNWAAACAFPNVKLHLYGKTQPRPGRKMGHLTALADTPEQALRDVLAARETLTKR